MALIRALSGSSGGGTTLELVQLKSVATNSSWSNTQIAASDFDMLVIVAALNDWKTWSCDGSTLTQLSGQDGAGNGLAAKIQNGYLYIKINYSATLPVSVYKIV